MRSPEHNAPVRPYIETLKLVVLLGALFFALPLRARTVVDFDPNLDYSKYKTYAFIGGIDNLVSMLVNPDLIDIRLHHTVSRELDKRGLHEVNPREHPDLLVRYWANGSSTVDVAVTGNWGPYGSYIGGYWTFVYNDVSASSQKEGALVIDLIDPRTKNLAWRLYLVHRISEPDKVWKKVDEEFAKGFDAYPPSDQAKDDKKRERAAHPPKPE